MARQPLDPVLFNLISRAYADDQRALASEVASASTEVGSPDHHKADDDRELSAEAWRNVVTVYERLRMAAHPSE